ncbi:hypothetical protein [Algicella marina]|uniref:Excalibur calcium-binding domain-containing protein n=1 Tax=Algicella marina TaxID=2683284 RepID=A0A6P1SYF1_9RHOB|nr:hypothetical protein [Algicella marina]QHQ34029.1 hypothetical protein GO499_01920 [Algicella marina]
MMRPVIGLGLLLAVAACSEEPAGGQGPFDPPPPPKVNSPLFATPGTQDFQPFPQTRPIPVPPSGSSSDQLAQDVATTLRTTPPPPGTPGSIVPSTTTTATITQPTATVQPQQVQSAQVVPGTGPGAGLPDDIGINPNDQSIDLNQSSQAEQKRQREIAEQRRLLAQQQLVIVQPEAVEQVDPNANVAKFARETTHPKGTKVYNRPAFRDRVQSASVCRRFSSDDDAQRQFLANGGPTTDRFNLDPDGDGFACRFDPETYRKLNF